MSDCQPCQDRHKDKRYCARLRCYCGHPECPAFASWEPLRAPNVTNIKPADERLAASWAQREEGSWIDGL